VEKIVPTNKTQQDRHRPDAGPALRKLSGFLVFGSLDSDKVQLGTSAATPLLLVVGF
jgi:hypothetical protein